MSEVNPTFIALGRRLKYAREASKKSLTEVSGAVEIDEQTLFRIESGFERPSEDILMLLINYFDIQDNEALRLWEMAEYSSPLPDELRPDIDISSANKVIMFMTQDVRTIYSDGLEAMINSGGITLQFTQTSGPKQNVTVAKIGMGIEQAHAMLVSLQTALLQANYPMAQRQIPSSKQSQD